MTNERARRFPLGLEDLVREPRRPEGRPGEVRAAALAASAALNSRQPGGRAATAGAQQKPQARAQGPKQTQAPAQLAQQGKQSATSPGKSGASPHAPAQGKPSATTQAQPHVASAAKAAAPPVSFPLSFPHSFPLSVPLAKPPASPSQRPTIITPPKPQAAPLARTPGKPAAQNAGTRTGPQSSASLRSATRQNERAASPNLASSGALALTSERVRERMVERLRANGVTDQRVLNAMSAVPRHMFVDPGLAAQAYEDAALPIGHHQTISKPSVVARMIELAGAGRALNNVLEIGTGCGYQAAVLSHVAREVYSIERIRPLSERAKTNLRPLRIPNIRLHYGDGRLGLPSAAPFDAIVIAAAGLDVPQALLEQLAIGGRLVAPVGSQDGQSQVLTLVERLGPAQWRESRLDRVFFVPLKSGVI
ncbi:protein-L-isoaspartate(D-aspartate) O-methyltransferase [Paraburkholderia sp. PREW-6R]|uniref:protein-L-isoaspartate(D-aspartate) O-methyltransferase n=1 Tax=Paraburkholderia sp. PREW-6R TaxID=3141544 RepID=UPI0031F4E51A